MKAKEIIDKVLEKQAALALEDDALDAVTGGTGFVEGAAFIKFVW